MTASESEKLLSKVSHPPPGSFDFESPSLKWEDGTYNKTTFKKVYIQADRFPGFLRGERERGLSDFYIRTSSAKHNNAAGSDGDKENTPDNDQHCFHASVRFSFHICNRDHQSCMDQMQNAGTLIMASANTPKLSLVFYTHK